MAALGAQAQPAQRAPRFDLRALVAFFALAYALSWSWALSLAAVNLVVRRGRGLAHALPVLAGAGDRGGRGDGVDHGPAGAA
jgi:hypothetical protein